MYTSKLYRLMMGILGILFVVLYLVVGFADPTPSLSPKDLEQHLVEHLGEEWAEAKPGDLVVWTESGRVNVIEEIRHDGILCTASIESDGVVRYHRSPENMNSVRLVILGTPEHMDILTQRFTKRNELERELFNDWLETASNSDTDDN